MAGGTYATTAFIKAWLSITGVGDDAIIDRCGLAAEKMIERKMGAVMIGVAGTRYFHAVDDVRQGGADLKVDYHSALTTVTNGDGSSITIATQIDRLPINGTFKNRLHLKGSSGLRWTYSLDPVGAIAIVANWGLVAAAANVPDDILQLAIEIGGWLYRVRDTSMGADILAQTRAGTFLMPGKMPPHLRERLNGLGSVLE